MTVRQTTRYPGIYMKDRLKGRVYEISYTDSKGRRVFKTVPGGLRDAQQILRTIQAKMDKGELVVQSKIKVEKCLELYLDSARHLAPKTKVVYECAARVQVAPRLGHIRISDLNRRHVAGMINEMSEQGLSAWTIRGALTVLSGACVYAMEEGWLGVNPVTTLDRRYKPKEGRVPMRILEQDEIKLLLGVSTPGYKELFQFLTFTGLRIGEALALDWEHIDFDLAHVEVRKSKTAAGVREVELPEFLLQTLAGMKGTAGPVFLNENGDRMTARRVQDSFKRTLRRAGLPEMRLHDLRHTFASLLLAQGEDPVYVAGQMGHSRPSTTLDVYAKLFNADKRKAAARERMHKAFEEVGG